MLWTLLDINTLGIVEVQLKTLQLILPLVTNYEFIQGSLLNSVI